MFTDTNRLIRFAQENNLTAPDGSAQMLETPTSNVIEYLERFVADGVHGVWFNSDTISEGYYIPIVQLKAIKEHLAKTGWQSVLGENIPVQSHSLNPATTAVPLATVVLIIRDGLALPSGYIKATEYACNFYCMVPHEWTENNEVKPIYLEKLYEKIYGSNWKKGNSDGSTYVIESSFSIIVTPEIMEGLNWTEAFTWIFSNTDKNHYWLFIAGENGEIAKATPEEFQKTYNLSRQMMLMKNPTVAPLPSKAEDYGLSKTPDGKVDQRIRIFRTGNVTPGASLLPFFSAFAPLLTDYQGFGEFGQILNFAPESMTNVQESVMQNQHGNYIRLRTFKYQKVADVADAMTIDSNQLRHVTTGATLLVSFTLLTMSEPSSAALYFSLEGGSSEVQNLLHAIAPVLESCGFVESEKK
ncbi:MAG: hypothetical protein ABIX01_09190 [Chitinophagaceae bacterium]